MARLHLRHSGNSPQAPFLAPRSFNQRTTAVPKSRAAALSVSPQAFPHAGIAGAASFSSCLGWFLGFTVAPFAVNTFRRLFRRQRRQRRSIPAAAQGGMSATFSVATFNLRAVMDRWGERQPLLSQCLKQVDADILCFQECLTGEFGQERRLLPPGYHVFPCKAALYNLASSGGLLRWYARSVERLLALPALCRLMVSLPVVVEAWRERLTLKSDVFRIIRDLTMAPFYGNSLACRIAEAHEINHSTLVLGDWRAAQRVGFVLGEGAETKEQQQAQNSRGIGSGSSSRHPDGRSSSGALENSSSSSDSNSKLMCKDRIADVACGRAGFQIWVVNTHLDHEHPDNRQRQALAVCDWMEKEKQNCAAIILCGDFNGAPYEPFHAVFRRLGYVSTYAQRHGREPQAPLKDEGDFECLDYVYIWTAPNYLAKVLSADVYGLQPAEYDKTLFPSDHAAVKATIQIQPDNQKAGG